MGRLWTPTRRGLIGGGLALAAAGPALAWTHGVGTAPAPTALWHADFVNGVYTVAGSPVALGDMFGQNTDWNDWDPAVVVPSTGWVGDGTGPVLLGATKAAVIAGATYVATLTVADNTAPDKYIEVDLVTLPSFDDEALVEVGYDLENRNKIGLNPEGTETQLSTGSVNGADKVAFTITPLHVAASLNGGSVVTLARVTPAGNNIGVQAGSSTILTLTAYAVQDDSALPGLST